MLPMFPFHFRRCRPRQRYQTLLCDGWPKILPFKFRFFKFRWRARWIRFERRKKGRKKERLISLWFLQDFEDAPNEFERRKERRKKERLISLWFFKDFENASDEFDSSLLLSEGRKEERKKERKINFSLIFQRFRRCARWIRRKEERKKKRKKDYFSLVFQKFRRRTRWIRFEPALERRKEERKERRLISLWFFKGFEDEFDSSLLSCEGRKKEKKKN